MGQLEALVAHPQYGQTRIGTILAENTIRPTKLGMENRLFLGDPDTGDRSAILCVPGMGVN